MATDDLRKRLRWQPESGAKAVIAEKLFYDIMTAEFEGTDFSIRPRPAEFKNIYSSVDLDEAVLAEIYNPDETWVHGVVLDFAIDNLAARKTLYVEVKRQDGWVEGKPRSAGRGNAHERSCKFFTPGLLEIMRSHGNLGDDVLPFWTIFQGDIARDPKRVREITFWYAEHSSHFFLWHNSAQAEPLVRHFNDRLRSLLT